MTQKDVDETGHDLITELHTEFKIFKQEQFPEFSRQLTQRIDRFFEILEKKADKEDVRDNRRRIDEIESRVGVLEATHNVQQIKKETFISIGKFGLSAWQTIGAIIATSATIAGAVAAITKLI